MKTSQEIYQETISKLSIEEKRAIFPKMTKKNFVVRKSWYGRGQIIEFTSKATKNKPEKTYIYNHDVVYDIMLPFLEHKAAWSKYGYWSQSTDLPMILRHRSDLLNPEDLPKKPKTTKKKK